MTSSRIYIVNGMLRKMRKEAIFMNKRILRELRIYTDKACTNPIGPEIVGYQKKAN